MLNCDASLLPPTVKHQNRKNRKYPKYRADVTVVSDAIVLVLTPAHQIAVAHDFSFTFLITPTGRKLPANDRSTFWTVTKY